MAARAAALMEMDDLVEAFLLRLPPDDPASLVRAALVCKLWRRILADRGFRRRFWQLHHRRTPPMLGFLAFLSTEVGPCFIPTSSFRPRNAGLLGLYAIGSRHGRVLLASSVLLAETILAVWDPISGERLEVPKLPALQSLIDSFWIRWNAAVLCASDPSTACDGIDCHLGHFLVVLMATSRHRAYIYVYSSEAGTWSEPTSAALNHLDPEYLMLLEPSALAGNALYFKFFTRLSSGGIFKYDLGMQEISWINLPSNCSVSEIVLASTQDGGLGIASVESSRLHLWSREAGRPSGHLGWAPSRVVELNTVLPANSQSIHVIAFLHGIGDILVSTKDGVFSVDRESGRARKICEVRCGMDVVPYMCFCTPAPDVTPSNTGEGPVASVPSA